MRRDLHVMTMVEWAGRTEAGKVRENNEDAFSIAVISAGEPAPAGESGVLPQISERGIVFTVADGVGGQNAGEVASALTVSGIAEELARFSDSAAPLPSRECGERLETALRRTNGRIRQEGASDPLRKDMAATASVLWLVGERGIIGQVGDSRIYRFRSGTLQQLSHDQSAVGRAVRAGKLSEDEARLTTSRSLLDQAMGVRDEVLKPEIDWIECLPGDVFLLCSDGLVDRLQDDDLAACMDEACSRGASPAQVADALMQRADESNSRDNVTVLLIRIGQVGTVAEPEPSVEARRRGIPWRAAVAGGVVGCVVGWVVAYAVGMLGEPGNPPDADRPELISEIEELRRDVAEGRRDAAVVAAQLAEVERLIEDLRKPGPPMGLGDTAAPPAEPNRNEELQRVADRLHEILEQLDEPAEP